MKAKRFIIAVIICISCSFSVFGYEMRSDNNDYDVVFYHLDLNVSDTSTYIQGSTSIFLKSIIPALEQVILDFSTRLITDSVLVNHQRVQYTHNADEIVVELNDPASEGNLIELQIYYHGLGTYSGVSSGIYNKYSTSWDKNITWTLSEPFSARNWFPCKQSLTDKADSVYVFLSTDNTLKAGSNGRLANQVPLPDERIRYEWKSAFPIVYYLISFAVSDYMDYSFYAPVNEGIDSILVQNYIYNDSSYLVQNILNINRTAELLQLYSDLFGPYPFQSEKYGHCVAPFSGGMEHQTMTTLVNFSFLLVAHELAHQWFGDYVTCQSWQDIWINEGFASYGEYLACQYLSTKEDAENWITGCFDYVKSVSGGSVYVPDLMVENEGRIFDSRLSYKKGASIIHMLRHEIGNDSLFFECLSTFLTKYKNGNASGADFKNHVEEKTGTDFDQFFDQWYTGQGYPIHSIRWEHRNDTLYINSFQTVSSVTPFFDVLIDFKITGMGTDTLISLRQTNNYTTWQVYLPGNITSLQADPDHWLLTDFSGVSPIANVISDSGFRIIPNPARDKVHIELDNPVGKYSIYLANSEGKIISMRESSEQREVIEVNGFPSGFYFIIIRYGKTIKHGKFVIN